MTETREIKCDACERDLTYTGNCEDYYLILDYGSKAPWYSKDGRRGGAVTSMAMSPPVDRTMHFCDLSCMDKWRDTGRIRAARWRKWYDEQKCRMYVPNERPTDDELAALYPDIGVAS